MIEETLNSILALEIVGIFTLVLIVYAVIDNMREKERKNIDKYKKSKKRGNNIW